MSAALDINSLCFCLFHTTSENEATVADPSMKTLRIIDGSGGGTTDLPFSTEVSTLTMTGRVDVFVFS